MQCDKNNITNNNIDDDYDDDGNNVVDDDVDYIVAQCTLLFAETTKLSFFYFVLKAGRIALVNHVIIISFPFSFHLELEAYSSIISAFRAQGELSRSVDLFVL